MCPQCNKPTECGCKSCIKRNGKNENTMIHEAEEAQCPHCKEWFSYQYLEDMAYAEVLKQDKVDKS